MKQIPLTRGKFAIVDDADFEKLNRYNWYAFRSYGNTFYAVRSICLPNGKWRLIFMHRVILNLEYGDKRQGDHRNNNSLDNRRDNLRICTNRQNSQNSRPNKSCTSVYKGVSWSKDRHKWVAQIKTQDKQTNLGRYVSEIEAARAYDVAAIKCFGEFAHTNGIVLEDGTVKT